MVAADENVGDTAMLDGSGGEDRRGCRMRASLRVERRGHAKNRNHVEERAFICRRTVSSAPEEPFDH